jgi:hypothetical protein
MLAFPFRLKKIILKFAIKYYLTLSRTLASILALTTFLYIHNVGQNRPLTEFEINSVDMLAELLTYLYPKKDGIVYLIPWHRYVAPLVGCHSFG